MIWRISSIRTLNKNIKYLLKGRFDDRPFLFQHKLKHNGLYSVILKHVPRMAETSEF